ncbi:uncharacterized protein UV8b_06199 [Ustilaginoidea virens]|uniref:Pyrroloquinoline quinone-dependent pyranose dehydrogenase beta-propeller domain-containing protein n=1 Tax=Ustilaginoidea virens TaxID=1159556 RepID=A0A8E5HUV1_USTVR|nr:uncharacterized protein UV8b_06199 [Ustilaginoidea virens]QUC21958.1 hypothetical protein UV8b_06199 [Ustilaginoidea virens]
MTDNAMMALVARSASLVLLASVLCGVLAANDNCSNTLSLDYPAPVAAKGWSYRVVANGFARPRGLVFDQNHGLLVIDSGVGLTHLTLRDNGGTCLSVTNNKTLVRSKELNHGIALSLDGKTLYASTSESVFSWAYDAEAISVSDSNRTLVTNMNNSDHTSRTLLLSRAKPGTLLVSRGSNSNVDPDARDVQSGHSQLRSFDLSRLTNGDGPFDFLNGTLLGWGLRNSVGIAEHPSTSEIWSVENSVDQLRRDGVDIHNDNPAEELNHHGTLEEPNGGNYGYPVCYGIWKAQGFPNIGSLTTGDQFPIDGAPEAVNDSSCNTQFVPPRLVFQAHTAPLDLEFNKDGTTAYVSFHGSWNRDDPTGYRIASISFRNGQPDDSRNSTVAATDILTNPDLKNCPDRCFRPVGLAWDSKGRLWFTSDRTGEIFVLEYNDGPANGSGYCEDIGKFGAIILSEAIAICEHAQLNDQAQENNRTAAVATDNEAEPSPPPQYPASEASSSSRPPPFSSLFAPLDDPVGESSGRLAADSAATEPCASAAVAAPAYSSSPSPEPAPFQPYRASSRVFYDPVGETKRALPRDTKGGSSRKDEEAEPPPAYSEGDSPLETFTYVMSAAGGAASIITQVQQGGPPVNSIGDVGADETISMDLRGTRFVLSRDELLTLPEFVLLSLFPNGLFPDGRANGFGDDCAVQVDYDPASLQYMLDFFRNVAQSIPTESSPGTSQDGDAMSVEPLVSRDDSSKRAGIIVLREDLDFYVIPPRADISQPDMIEVKRAAASALQQQGGIFSGLKRSDEPGTTEAHLIEMLTAGGFNHDDTWGHRAGEPNKAVICSLALARLRSDIRGNDMGTSAVGMAQKLLLFWRKPARRCWWEGVELDHVEGVEGKLKVWIRRVWTLEMSVIGLR